MIKLDKVINWIFGILVLGAGILNMFWGNDPWFGVFIFLLAFIFFPPVNIFIKKKTGYSIHWALKINLALFIIWVVLGVGELFSKIDLMKESLF